jgi:hypothetical protein
MKLGWIILCLIVGHNKVLHVNKEVGYFQYFTVCSQCHRKWLNNQLTKKPHTSFKSHSIKIKAHVKTIVVNSPQRKVEKNKS